MIQFITSVVAINLPITCPADRDACSILTTELIHRTGIFYEKEVCGPYVRFILGPRKNEISCTIGLGIMTFLPKVNLMINILGNNLDKVL